MRPVERATPPLATLLALLAAGCGAADSTSAARSNAGATQCLPDGSGYLRAQLRGALNADLDWHDAQIRCEGGARPDGQGLRVSIAGPLPQSVGADAGRTLRFVFGIDGAAAASDGSALATNLTAIIEGGTVFATRGDDKCTTDRLERRTVTPAAARRPAGRHCRFALSRRRAGLLPRSRQHARWR